jgi:hypothetical protein
VDASTSRSVLPTPELSAVRWKARDINLTEGHLTVNQALKEVSGQLSFGKPKWNSRRTIHLPANLVKMLRGSLEGIGDTPVFTSREGQLRTDGCTGRKWGREEALVCGIHSREVSLHIRQVNRCFDDILLRGAYRPKDSLYVEKYLQGLIFYVPADKSAIGPGRYLTRYMNHTPDFTCRGNGHIRHCHTLAVFIHN